MTSPRTLWALALCCAAFAGTHAAALRAQTAWVTEADYEFGDAPEQGVSFSWPSIVVDAGRDRILALDPASAQVSAWTPAGALLFAVGRRGEGPGEFVSPGNVHVEQDGGFSVQEGGRSRYSYFAANGELLRLVQGPGTQVSYQGFRLELHRPGPDSAYLGVPQFPAMPQVGSDDVGAFDRQPILQVRDAGSGEWDDPRPVFWLDRSNRTHVMQIPDAGEFFGAQPFGDSDQVAFAPGRAVVLRQKGAPGEVELIEIGSAGDTVWHRRLQFEPRRLTDRMVDEAAEAMMAMLGQRLPQTPRGRLRQIYDEGLHRPDFLPPVYGPPVLTSSGEVWLRTNEISDTLRVHHVVERGDAGSEPRQVLLPEGMWIYDATETHVWGVRQDALDVPRIVGRRLIRGGSGAPQPR